MKNYLQLRLKNFPEIDEKNMLSVRFGHYNALDQIFFSRENREGIRPIEIAQPNPICTINKSQDIYIFHGPEIDMTSKSFVVKYNTLKEMKRFYFSHTTDYLQSFFVHGALVLCYVIMNYVTFFKKVEPQVVEVSFGLSDKITQSRPEEDLKQPDGQTEATKTISDLPQLPNNAAPDLAPKSSSDKLVFNDKNKTPLQDKKEQEESKKPVGPKLDTSQKSVETKDFLKRKEEDLRKIAQDKKDGVHGKDLTKPNGQKPSLTALPKSPFQNSENIPLAPPGMTPAGDEKGTNVVAYDAYRVYLKNQLKLNWKTNQGVSFPDSLKSVIEFTINPFGYLLGKPIVFQSSGNNDFDKLALEAVQFTFPVSNPPPKSINPPQTFKATYSTKDVN